MKFLDFLKKKQDTHESYIGLFFKEQEMEAFLYEIKGHAITTLAHKVRSYTSGWDKITEDTDDVLFQIEQETKLSFEKVILFLHSHLIDDESKQIKDPYKASIKKLLKQLELHPLGYIQCYEAVLTHLQKRDHTLLNAILVELDGTNISTYLYMGGRQVYRSDIEKNTSLVHHLNSEFEKMKKDTMLPSRLVIFGEQDYQKEVDEVIGHEFETGFFIQMPKVELFTKEALTTALGDTFKDQILDRTHMSLDAHEEAKQPHHAPDENFEVMHTKSPVEDHKKSVMGFVIGDEVGQEQSEGDDDGDGEEPYVSPVANAPKKNAFASFIPLITSKMKRVMPMAKKIMPKGGNKIPYAIGAGVLVLFLGVFALEYFFHKTQLIVYFPSQTIDKNLSVPAVLGENQINLRVGTVSAQVSDKRTTTGKRDVGEKAKGEVTINNFEDNGHVFSKGTKLTAGGHSFVLDEEVKVASGSMALIGSSYVIQPGTAKGNTIATDLGPESNLGKNTKFQIENFSMSSYFAINEAALAGGSKKEVKTVAKADVDALRKQAVIEGSKQAEADLKKVQNNRDEQVLGALTEAAPKKLDFSKEVGEEASEVKLSASVGVTYYTYSANQLKSYLKKELDPEVKDGFALAPEKIAYTVKDAKLDGDEVTMAVDTQAQAVRKFSREDILNKVAGKSQKQLEKILKEELKATGYEVKTTSSPVFFLSGRMPISKNNIDIKIDSL